MDKYTVTTQKINTLYESSVNRLSSWIKSHDVATITAFRQSLCNIQNPNRTSFYVGDSLIKEGHEFTIQEKRIRNKELYALLLREGFGVTKIHGSYLERNADNSVSDEIEESFFVVNIKDDPEFFNKIFKLSEYFNQDSFLYKSVNSQNAVLVGTNASEFPGYKNEINQGTFRFMAGRYMSRIKNAAFSFANKDVIYAEDPANLPDTDDQVLIKNNKVSDYKRKIERINDWTSIVNNEGINFPKFNGKERQALGAYSSKLYKRMTLNEQRYASYILNSLHNAIKQISEAQNILEPAPFNEMVELLQERYGLILEPHDEYYDVTTGWRHYGKLMYNNGDFIYDNHKILNFNKQSRDEIIEILDDYFDGIQE